MVRAMPIKANPGSRVGNGLHIVQYFKTCKCQWRRVFGLFL